MFFPRQVEVLLSYEDDYSQGTAAQFIRDDPYIENVVQTTDLETTITEFDPELGTQVTKTVPAGTWVNFAAWLSWCNIPDNRRRSKAPL